MKPFLELIIQKGKKRQEKYITIFIRPSEEGKNPEMSTEKKENKKSKQKSCLKVVNRDCSQMQEKPKKKKSAICQDTAMPTKYAMRAGLGGWRN